MKNFRILLSIAAFVSISVSQNASAQSFIYNDGQYAESCYTSNKPYNWIIYKSVQDNSCPTQRPSYRFYMVNTANFPSGTRQFTCSLWGLSGWSVVISYARHPMCQGIEGAAEIRKN